MKIFNRNKTKSVEWWKKEGDTDVLTIESIRFNNEGDAETGSIHFRKNQDEKMSQKFLRKAGSREITDMVGVFVPKRLKEILMTVEVKNHTTAPLKVILTGEEDPDEEPLLGPAVAAETEFLPGVVTSVEIRLNAAATLQKGFSKRENCWTFTYMEGSVQIPVLKSSYTVYTLLDLPRLPWRYCKENYDPYMVYYVWLELLDVCKEAVEHYGLKKKTGVGAYRNVQVAALTGITEYLNESSAFRYDTTIGASYYMDTGNEIKLKKFLRDVKSTGTRNPINCTDCANILVIQALAMGIPANVGTMLNVHENGFSCNEIIPIGCDAETPSWQVPFKGPDHPGGFSYHAVMVSDDIIASRETEIFDSCLKLDKGDFPGKHVDGEKHPYTPVFYTFAETKNAFIDVPPDERYRGNFYRERLAADGTECALLSDMTRPTGFSIRLTAADTLEHKEKERAARVNKPGEKEVVERALEPEKWESAGQTLYRVNLMKRLGVSAEKTLTQARVKRGGRLVDELYLPPFWQIQGVTAIERIENEGKRQIWNLQTDNAGKITVDAYRADSIEEAVTYLGIMLASLTTRDIRRSESGVCTDAFEIGDRTLLFCDRNLVCMVGSEKEMTVAWDVCERIMDYNNY